MFNPQSHSAHYFCHLHEYSAHKVQESRGITLRNYKNTNRIYLCSNICQIKTIEVGSYVRGGDLKSEMGCVDPAGSPSILLLKKPAVGLYYSIQSQTWSHSSCASRIVITNRSKNRSKASCEHVEHVRPKKSWSSWSQICTSLSKTCRSQTGFSTR